MEKIIEIKDLSFSYRRTGDSAHSALRDERRETRDEIRNDNNIITNDDLRLTNDRGINNDSINQNSPPLVSRLSSLVSNPCPVRGVKNINLTIQKGEYLVILGRNGSGKSTLAKLINGFLVPHRGSVTVNGILTSDNKRGYELRSSVGMVFQNPDNQMVASSIEDDVAFGPENLGVPREEIRRRVDYALNATGITELKDRPPNKLSGGQKQRVAIASVLAMLPKVLILDEATAMLDPRGREEVLSAVERLNKEEGISVINITHYVSEAVKADKVAVLHNGEIVAYGTPREVFSDAQMLETAGLVLPIPTATASALGLSVCLTNEELCDLIQNSEFRIQNEGNIDNNSTPMPYALCPMPSPIPSIKASSLSHTYSPKSPHEQKALKEVSFEICEGEVVGLIGSTGSGKSTLAMHLNGLIKLQSGELSSAGVDLAVKKPDYKKLRSSVGMLFQYPEYQLFANTVLEDVCFAPLNFGKTKEEALAVAKNAIELVGLNYEDIKDKSPFELSGGQKRRVAIAGVIASEPKILILDEPTAGLDPIGKREILNLILKLKETFCKTIIIISHNMDEIAEYTNRVLVLSHGELIKDTTPRILFSNEENLSGTGLNLPSTAKIASVLREKGIEVGTPLTLKELIQNTHSAFRDERRETRDEIRNNNIITNDDLRLTNDRGINNDSINQNSPPLVSRLSSLVSNKSPNPPKRGNGK
ncbi:MAG: energy-coupling factor transporter ATPase [Firmicutes bacterium]|nr:energy-coupling factor transporter ATPase [Bacillota bacterium]